MENSETNENDTIKPMLNVIIVCKTCQISES